MLDQALKRERQKQILQTLAETEETILSAIDPVDWTLAEGFMKASLEEFIASVALLISPLLMRGFTIDPAMTAKAPVEKLSSYPITTQSMQLMLQAKLKGMQCLVCCKE